MGKRLIIAEKPSVAKDIAAALGVGVHNGILESDQWVISSAVGHLLEITLPEDMREHRTKWDLRFLPLLPHSFALQPTTKGKTQLEVLRRLIQRPDVTSLINACDAGREGELIFHYIIRYIGTKKPVERLWLQSMTHQAIKASFAHLRPGEAMHALTDAAVSRAESDWLVGINGSRVLTLTDPEGKNTPIGRVQTPTLALVVDRENSILNFVPKPFWQVKAHFHAKAGVYIGTWFKSQHKPASTDDLPDRIWEPQLAESIRSRCLGKPGDVTETTKPVSKNCPQLYDLTTLQREANKQLGFSASRTLQVAQALYEEKKVLTYPRTDARVLPDDYAGIATDTLKLLVQFPPVAEFAQEVLSNSWVRSDNKRVFNSAKVTDHFAIIPTTKLAEGLTDDETKLYLMVAKRFVAVFFPAAEYLDTERITAISQDTFKTRGRKVIVPGWTRVYGAKELEEKDTDLLPSLPKVETGERPPAEKVDIIKDVTKPPPRYTEATLLSAMEHAGNLMDDEELKEAMSARGLGTPATRASIIEGLLEHEFLTRKKTELHPTGKGMLLISRLRSLSLEEICSPQLTGEWEFQLKQMELGYAQRHAFMQGISASVVKLVGRVKQASLSPKASNLRCPKCQALLETQGIRLTCPSGHLTLYRVIAKRSLTDREMQELLEKGQVGPLQGFTSKAGRPFAAKLRLGADKVEFVFDTSAEQQPLEKLNWDGWDVGVLEKFYVAEKDGVLRRISRVILQRPISKDEAKMLLLTGKTGFLDGFISSKTNRPFRASLLLDATGKLSFGFEPKTGSTP